MPLQNRRGAGSVNDYLVVRSSSLRIVPLIICSRSLKSKYSTSSLFGYATSAFGFHSSPPPTSFLFIFMIYKGRKLGKYFECKEFRKLFIYSRVGRIKSIRKVLLESIWCLDPIYYVL